MPLLHVPGGPALGRDDGFISQWYDYSVIGRLLTKYRDTWLAAMALLLGAVQGAAGGQTIATFTRNPSNPILRGVRIQRDRGEEPPARGSEPSVSPSNHLDAARYAPFDTLRRPAFGSVSDAGTESGRVNPGVAEQDLIQPHAALSGRQPTPPRPRTHQKRRIAFGSRFDRGKQPKAVARSSICSQLRLRYDRHAARAKVSLIRRCNSSLSFVACNNISSSRWTQSLLF